MSSEAHVPMSIAHGMCSESMAPLLKRIAELEAAVLAAKVLLEPTTEKTEQAWQLLDDAYHRDQ